MPDRSKRRKNNNKNKRKHKNSNNNQNKNNLESNNKNGPLQLEETCDFVDNNRVSVEAVNELCDAISSTCENSVDNGLEYAEINNNNTAEDLVNEQQTESIPESSSINYIEGITIVHKVSDEESPAGNEAVRCEEIIDTTNVNVESKPINSSTETLPNLIYIVESPERSVLVEKNTDDEKRDSVVSDADSGVEWEAANTEKSDIDSPQSESNYKEDNATKESENLTSREAHGLTPEEESTLRDYLNTLDLATQPSHVGVIEIVTDIQDITVNHEIKHRLQRKNVPDDFFSHRSGRLLDVIDEEGSNESSISSRRHSDLCDKRIEAEDHKNHETDQCKLITPTPRNKSAFVQKNIPQECVLVDAKIKEPEFTEARGDWSLKTLETMTGAETVYLTDHSSSTSSVNDLNDETDEGVETDASIRMMTPIIEVTDMEKLLKSNFLINNGDTTSPKQIVNNEAPTIIPSESHEIVVLSTDDIKTSLYVKDLKGNDTINQDNNKTNNLKYNTEIQELKSELNNAMNKLLNEVNYDSDTLTNPKENTKSTLARQDSSSSIGSSQCTAKYNPNFSSLNDVSNILHDEKHEENNTSHSFQISHVKEVFESVTGLSSNKIQVRRDSHKQPQSLRDICVSRIAHLPYGDQVLEELAAVSKQLQNINVLGHRPKTHNLQLLDNIPKLRTNVSEMPYYPLPDVSSIERVALPSRSKMPIPPPINPRYSSLKKANEDSLWTGLPTMNDRAYVCLSPSQKMLMEKTNTVITKEDASNLIDTHKRYIERRGYNEYKIDEDNPPAVPFKSKTGSRLLALIRDPAVTNNTTNYPVNLSRNKSYDNIYAKKSPIINYNYQNDKTIRKHNEFKPIPPPRPKKYSATYYESDESSDYFTDSSLRSMKSERKFYHHSTGNLSKEIEEDVHSIQQLHKRFTSKRDENISNNGPRRPSLPKDICEQQLEYIKQKEKEVEAEIERLENLKLNVEPKEKRSPRAPLISEKEFTSENYTDANNYSISHRKDYSYIDHNSSDKHEKSNVSSAFSSSQEEIMREKMYSEYMTQIAERQERRQQKVIKITNKSSSKNTPISKSTSAIDVLDKKVNNPMEKEFICKARERLNKLGIKDPETEDEKDNDKVYKEPKPKTDEPVIKVMQGDSETDVKQLPTHLQEFVRLTAKDKRTDSPETVMIAPTFKARSASPAVWKPGSTSPAPPVEHAAGSPATPVPPPPPLPVWSPGSAGASPISPRRSFRPVHFEETPPPRRKFPNPPSEQNGTYSGSESENRLRTSISAPASGLNNLGAPLSPGAPRLPRAQNPTVTLLQKAREGQFPRGANYLQQQERDSARLPRDRASPPRGHPVHALRREYASEGEEGGGHGEARGGGRMSHDHVLPTTQHGMPTALRSEAKDQTRWYKKMYDTIHKNKYDDDYVTIRYKNRRGELPSLVGGAKYAYFDPRSGYLSEPEGGRGGAVGYSSRRRTASVQEHRTNDNELTSPYLPSNKYSTLASARASHEVYKNQPGKIENYVPGKSSVVDKEAKQWWDEVMDIFDGQLSSTTSLPQALPKEKRNITSAILSNSNMARALKESGYESDSQLIFRRRSETEGPLSPAERRAAYKDLQAGGEPPLRGFRSPAPNRTDDSEIEYIPISPTLTKIRVHKKTPHIQEVKCYPVTKAEKEGQIKFKRQLPSFLGMGINPPAPPRRISSRNSRTLKLITSTRPASMSPKRQTNHVKHQSNVDFLKAKISNKLSRQNMQIITKKDSDNPKTTKLSSKSRVQSISAPPAVNRKSTAINKTGVKRNGTEKQPGTSSFGSPRKTLLPAEYTNPLHTKYHDKPSSSVVIEGGAGRRTPITNILDKVTSLDKLWSSEKRNEPIDKQKAKASLTKANSKVQLNSKSSTSKVSPVANGNRGRDMVRTSEKVQKIKAMNSTKSNPVVNKMNLARSLNSLSNVSQSRKPYSVKTAVVTKLKKKQSLEDVTSKSRYPNGSNKKHLVNTNKSSTKKSTKPKKTSSKSSNDSESESQFGDISYDTSNFGSIEELYGKRITAKEIRETRDAVMSDSFFQNLFLGSPCSSLITYPVTEMNTTVLQKAKMFQSYPQDYYSQKSINSYLINRKPVSLSKFKLWDQYSGHTRAPSPRSVSWPGRMHGQVKKFDSLSKPDLLGSCSSLTSVRSKSEPPVNRLYFSQTSRPKSPSIIFVKKQGPGPGIISPRKTNDGSNKIVFSQTSRPVSPKVVKTVRKSLKTDLRDSVSPTRLFFSETVRPVSPVVKKHNTIIKDEQSESICLNQDHDTVKKPLTLYFSQTSRPVSPRVERKATYASVSRSESTSPIAHRSPSYRRITNSRQYPTKFECKVFRTQSAGDAEKRTSEKRLIVKTKSETNLQTNDPDYDEYVLDMQNNKARSERFRELNRYYTYLERVGELERATSTSDLRHRRKYEEIIDFDRWKKIRAIERAEQELHNLYYKLKMAQSENDVLFYPRDVNDFRWNLNTDRGLKIKEKSVEDLKEHFQRSSENLSSEPYSTRDSYKLLWRGKSVAETAFNIDKDNKSTKKSNDKAKYSVPIKNDASLTEIRRKLGIGNCLWSSLSMDQVNALKDQLNSIYSKELESKLNKEKDMYSVNVPEKEKPTSRSPLHVRSNSLISTSPSPTRFSKINKSESIAAICPLPYVKEIKNNVTKSQLTLTESEKKKISQTLSNEVMKRLKKVEHAPLTLQQELEISENGHTLIKNKENISLLSNTSTESVVEPTWQSKKRHVIFPPKSNETAQQSSASETETGSSDISNKTVIYKGSSKEVQEKIKYFESVKTSAEPKVVYHAREDSDEKSSPKNEKTEEPEVQQEIASIIHSPIGQSQSCSDFKDLFGETDKNKFLSLPLNKSGKVSRSPSPRSEVYSSDRHAVDTTRYSSEETIWRSRSPSPDPERYWRACLNLARAGEVRRLVRRFDSPGAPASFLRRHRSDPELSRIRCLTDWQSTDQLVSRSRLGHKTSLPVAKVPLRPGNRFMPHIDVISKLASLRRRTTTRSRSAEDTLDCRQGEVERIRRRFEVMSLLGQIYASAPDVSELRDIAPYLAGPWIAHQYPKKSDNTKPLKENSKRNNKLSKKELKTSKKQSVKLSSILKSDLSSKQVYDPSLHRPVSRYEPPRAPPRPPPAAWPYFLAPYVMPSRHSVKFQAHAAPPPPHRSQLGSVSDTESPRRYVESDVNIHYRCPVRRDPLPLVPERELARQQAEHMKRLYREQKRTKYLQDLDIDLSDIDAFDASIKELQDMQNRRHQDNFTPSQKAIVPLNRYDDADKVMAKALYTFNGLTARELSFKKGDLINVRRQIDANWYEGELHGRVGLFPYNYVEVLKGDIVHSPKKTTTIEGRARAKFDFTAQTNLELPLKKGEIVVLTRRIDHNWWEGRNGNKTGIFPDSYVTILQTPSQNKPEPSPTVNTNKPVVSPASHGLMNGSARSSMGAHSYTPQINSPALSNAPSATEPLPVPGYRNKGAVPGGYGPPLDLNNREPLYVDTNAEAVPYRAMYKYRPQNPDELELSEGDTVYVLEKCDDGWYVGSSQRTGRFGTFPGNYVERI